ncbi:winged helix-turn-helix transcriptional regulator [Gulosibacter chungangensis]|uniref:Winged helix-turn-helix transcriptional regulator n=1 Tax=Gulosibacter chungangensis TaxID=979746 RepID=A0A7J5BC19_9MICO|nr:winged helix-turn-helix transcriptional regulator [Gulosibacter chungangensis]
MRDLELKLSELTKRVEQLESEQGGKHPASASVPVSEEEQFWALHGLQARLADHPRTAGGAVMIVGSAILPDGTPVAWQPSAGSDGLLETDWSDLAGTLSALGHPGRLELIRHILSGVHGTAELAEITSLGTTGKLHHHLRQLVAAGWVRQSGRGSYEVPAARVVPLLACLTGAER